MVNKQHINDKMVKYTKCLIIVLLTLLELCVLTQMSIHDSNGFIQNNNEIRYLVDVDDISTIHKGYPSEARAPKFQDSLINSWLRFEPEFLDFKERPLGVPHLEKVTLYNVNSNKSLDMSSISGNTMHFHSSFFEDKVIPPLGNTSFNVVFLGRQEGHIHSNLYIHTKDGTYKYQVKGSSVASPYRLRPIVDIRVPLNVSFSPLIYMHNPHTYPIQIVEVYSSGGDFHLELPTGELEGPKDMWEIPPFHTKPVIRVRFNARLETNYTAYVRIKVSNINTILVVPLEVEVSSQNSLYTPQGTLDFGLGGTLDQPKQIKLMVHNTMKKLVKIHSVMCNSKAVKVDFQQVKVQPETKDPVEIASLTVDWKTAFEQKDFYGKILVKYKQGRSRLEIPYWITVFEGGLVYNDSATKYLMDGTSLDHSPREFTVTNKYHFPLAVNNVTFTREASQYFSIDNFKSIILMPGESTVLFILTLYNRDPVTVRTNFNFKITIHTNISSIVVPLLTYDGKLKLMLPNRLGRDYFDLGLVSSDSYKEAHFVLMNKNPVDIEILNFGASTTTCRVQFVGCSKDNIRNDVHLPSSNVTKCSKIQSGVYGVFQINVDTHRKEGVVEFQVNIQTKYETVSIPVRMKVSNGNLEIGPDRLVFDECFPGKICSHPLRIHSTYNEPMVIQSISSIPPDPRLSSAHSGHITTRSTRVVGHLFLDPSMTCNAANNCYTGFPLNTSLGLQWLETFSAPSKIHDFDYSVLNTFYTRYLNATCGGKRWQNLTLRLDTSEVKGHFFQTRVKLSWPKLVVANTGQNRSIFSFPLTQIGQTCYKNITLKNPSDSPLTLQLIMDWAYPKIKNNFKSLPNIFTPNTEDTLESHAFFFHENHSLTRTKFESETKILAHKNSVPVILKPRETIDIIIGFKATVSTLRSALMYIRNNLTMLEIIRLNGQGANPNFRFGNRKPGSNMPFLFELTEKHLKDCEREKNRKNPAPNLTVKKSFTARNTGDVTITIKSFSINGFPCEGYGFRVLNCQPFDLPPNSTRKIDIAFTPDFTLSKIQRVLILETSLNIPVNYTLITTLPPYFLAPCSSILARPNWEPMLYYASICLMMFLLFIVISVCFIESDRILRTTLIIQNDIDTQPLDLRLIGTQTRNEILSKNKIEEKNCSKENKDSVCKTSWTETKEVKEEKYSSLISCPKKKKVGKKNSIDNSDCKDQKTCNKIKETIEKKRVTPTLKIEKKLDTNKRQKKTKEQNSEEETSSTTTESSNNDEVEKYNKKDKTIFKKNKSPTIQTCDYRDNYEGDGEDDDFQESVRYKTPKKLEIELKQDQKIAEKENKRPYKNNSRKEKKGEKKRLDKKVTEPQPAPKSPPPPIWGENRASFSDVVARSDSSSFFSNPIQRKITKPTLYVEPNQKDKPSANELGPIGSKKPDMWGEKSYPKTQSNSFFTEPPCAMAENYFEVNNVPDLWNSQDSALDFISNGLKDSSTEDIANVNPMQATWPSTYWEPFCCTPIGECRPAPSDPQTALGTDFLWSTSRNSVWSPSPWAPLPNLSDSLVDPGSTFPSTVPVRTPPGFGGEPENDRHERLQGGFDPFRSLSNIWTPHNAGYWNTNGSTQ